MRRAISSIVGVGLLIGVLAAPAWAQSETATVSGTVVDEQQGVLPGVTVTARQVETGLTRFAVTDGEGRYRIPLLPSGPYVFTAALEGFDTTARDGVVLTLGAEVVLNLTMKVGSLDVVVRVTADTPVVETTTHTSQTVLNREQVDVLPMVTRDYSSIVQLAPGVGGTSFLGLPSTRNQWVVDGVSNTGDISGGERQSMTVEAVEEFQIIVTGFKAEYGQASGGVINIATRSGTNQLRGRLFTMFRNQELMSRNPYLDRSQPADPFTRLHSGGFVGGPIRRDRAHYFGAYENTYHKTFGGGISNVTLPPADAPFSPGTLDILRAGGVELNRFGAGGVQRFVTPRIRKFNRFTGRADVQLDERQTLTLRHIFFRSDERPQEVDHLMTYSSQDVWRVSGSGMVSHKWMVNSRMVNEAYVQYSRVNLNESPRHPGLVNISVSGNFSLGGGNELERRDNVIQIVDTLTWTRGQTRTGSHTVKLGTQLRFFRSDDVNYSNARGTWTFPNMAAFIEGRPSRFTQNQGDFSLDRPFDDYGFFIQDDWRPVPSLTLNLGLRYDYDLLRLPPGAFAEGERNAGIRRDKDNFAPRFGFAYAPGGSTSQAFYGGIGKYFDKALGNLYDSARFIPPKVLSLRFDNPSFPDPFTSAPSIPVSSTNIFDPNMKTPYGWNTQIGYRRELTDWLGVDASFVYNQNYDRVQSRNLNQGLIGSANINGAGVVRPDPNFVNINYHSNFGRIRYKGLLLEVRKRHSHGFQGGFAYTLGRAEEWSVNQLYESGFDAQWRPAGNDRLHRLRAHLEGRLPLGIEVGTIFDFSTETPRTISSGFDLNGDGVTGDPVNELWCVNIECPGFHYDRNSIRQLSTEEANRLRQLFDLPPIESSAKNPKFFLWNATVRRSFRLPTDHRITLIAQGFNLPNRPIRTIGSNAVNNRNFFARYNGIGQERAIQFLVQYNF